MPHAFEELMETMEKLEQEYRDMQDVEFTVERDNLYMLQTRSAKRTGVAALKVAYDMAEEGLISREEAVLRIEPDQLNQVLHPYIDPEADMEILATGLPASPGAATGAIVLTAEEKGEAGEPVILVRKETNPDDVHGMVRARGILTALGGMTSHAAVVARGFGKPAVTGCKAIEIDLVVEIMIPLVSFGSELEATRNEAAAVVREVLGEDAPVQIGTMIELPRACTTAGEIAERADFFSFGTNDLTQTTCGLSRDDAEGGFLTTYLDQGILEKNPFETLDRDGVGRLVSLACERGREANPNLKLGICGEHGGDPESIEFFHEVGLDYVSCSPYRVPIARLAAAQAALTKD